MSALTASQRLSREDYRRQKDLEAARKAGTAPAEKDEEGNEINPHIPQYIAKAPWYLDTGHASLKHQKSSVKRKQTSEDLDGGWYARGTFKASASTKYRKGACENCGAATHKTKDCVDRPRKLGARWTGLDIKPDESIQDVELSFDGKRDRWNGYDPAEHKKILEEWELIEDARKKLKAKELDKAVAQGEVNKETEKVVEATAKTGAEHSSDEEDDDEDKYADRADMPGSRLDTKTRMTVRNLRIREDRAKYLYDLKPNSAHYDPKTRSMRDNPAKENPDVRIAVLGARKRIGAFAAHAGAAIYTGDAPKLANLQLFAWQAQERGQDVHLQANPTLAELHHREYESKKESLKDTTKSSILEKYGGAEHLDTPPKELLLAQTENYVEYSMSGRVIKGQEKACAKSKYVEDEYPGNHTSVWGSYWADGKWGFRCCHQFGKNAYCTGLAGIEAAEEAARTLKGM
ncbi:MAG: SLU7 splicing factor [Olpidium bornovanus]|uniref:Pre-mRNA-splicing factor SLU7 n=1 Tax=Olpidium bornovanus TaxID=278681 RepID=A0A8H7ZN62_9FUNG|nr:MAG: SLU7 splicing factor [Olpidium bornovanus]